MPIASAFYAGSPYQQNTVNNLQAPIGGVPTGGNVSTNNSGPNGPFSSLQGPMAQSATNSMNSGNTILNTAFDPQNTLYNQQRQTNTDQINVAEAQRGVTMSPYGAGVANQSDQNFNTNWQNQQLDRQIKGLTAQEGSMANAKSLYDYSNQSTTQSYGQPQSQPQAAASKAPVNMAPINYGGGGGTGGSPYAPQQQQPLQQQQPQDNGGGGYTGPQQLLTPIGQQYQDSTNPTAYPSDANGNPIPTDSSSSLYDTGSYGGQLPPDQPYTDPNNTQASDPYATMPQDQSSVISDPWGLGSTIMNSVPSDTANGLMDMLGGGY